MSRSTARPVPMAFSHPTAAEARAQARTGGTPAARQVEFTAPGAAQTTGGRR
ncbi:MAG: hypothetical protein M3422_05015 [Actinomycetota bacterium]|nr:hypothetical protein [Actinomycetota bacterium]